MKIVIAKEEFNRTISLLTSKINTELKTKLFRCLDLEHYIVRLRDLDIQKTGEEAFDVFLKANNNIKPALEVKSRRVGGANYQVPIEVRPDRSQALAFRWLVGNARKRGGHSMAENLANEIIDASNGVGAAVKKREDTHRMAEANKAFAHYRW